MRKLSAGPGGYVIWLGDEWNKELDKTLAKNMASALAYFKHKTQRNVGVPARILRRKKIRGKGNLKYPIREHSKPGEFPRVIEGDLRRSIFMRGPRWRNKAIEGDVGTKLNYAIRHEITRRPFVRRTLFESQKAIGDILSGKVTQRVGSTDFAFNIATMRYHRISTKRMVSYGRVVKRAEG